MKIEGICAVPCRSRNGVYYPANELAQLDGSRVPIMYSHIGSPYDKGVKIADVLTVGSAETYWKKEEQELWYEGKIKEQYSTLLYRMPNLRVSIGAHYTELRAVPKVATKIILEEISLTTTPAITAVTLKIVESFSRPRLDWASQMKLEQAMKRAMI